MRVALDAMGGDYAPVETVTGAVVAARDYGVPVVLVGNQEAIQRELGRRVGTLPIDVVHAPEIVGMEEHPAAAVRRKRDSSINVALRLLRDGHADAFFSAGNSGAVVAAALLLLGRLEGIHRPALAWVFPLLQGQTVLLDVGANADVEPHNLLEFALLGSAYVEHVYGVTQPRVGLLSIGEEENKGNALVLAAQPLLRVPGLNFIGKVEGHDIFAGTADVVVCDGFVGNVVLKTAEGCARVFSEVLRSAIRSGPHFLLAGRVLQPALYRESRRLDYTEYGGVPLLGVRGPVFIGHGRSRAKAIASGLRVAHNAAASGLVARLQERLTSQPPVQHVEAGS